MRCVCVCVLGGGIGQKSGKWQWRHNFPTWRQHQFFWRYFVFVSLVKFSYWSKFHVNILTGSGIMTVFFVRDWPEIRKSEIPPSEFCPISGDWGELRIPLFARMSLIECYWMLQNSRVKGLTWRDLHKSLQCNGIAMWSEKSLNPIFWR